MLIYLFLNDKFSLHVLGTVYEKTQSITTNEGKIAKLQAQVEKFEAISAEKSALTAKYEAIVKENEGQNIHFMLYGNELHVTFLSTIMYCNNKALSLMMLIWYYSCLNYCNIQ